MGLAAHNIYNEAVYLKIATSSRSRSVSQSVSPAPARAPPHAPKPESNSQSVFLENLQKPRAPAHADSFGSILAYYMSMYNTPIKTDSGSNEMICVFIFGGSLNEKRRSGVSLAPFKSVRPRRSKHSLIPPTFLI